MIACGFKSKNPLLVTAVMQALSLTDSNRCIAAIYNNDGISHPGDDPYPLNLQRCPN
jgi:hypothetical protein